MKGYLDRIEEERAVILVEEMKKEYVMPVSKLPEGSQPKTWFDLVIDQDKIISITINKEKTETELGKVEDMVSKLRSKSKGSKYKRE